MPIRQLPPVPTRDDPNNFALKGDAFLAALPGFVDDANALEQSLQMMATMGLSTTPLTVGLGSKTLTTDPGKAWATGAWVYVFASAAVSNYMVGRVTSYNATTGALVVNVSAIDGSGTHSAWVIGLATPAADGHLLRVDGSRAMTAELLLAANAVNALGAVPRQQLEQAVSDMRSLTATTNATTILALADRGALIRATAANTTIPANVFGSLDVVTIYNDTATTITLTQGAGLTLRLAGTATAGNRSLAQRGLTTIVFITATEAVASGAGLS